MRLIDADGLKERLVEVMENIRRDPKMTRDEIHIISGCHMLCEMIYDAPTIDAVPVVHARWVARDSGYANCSNCDWEHPEKDARGYCVTDTYCPNCGAKMDGGESP